MMSHTVILSVFINLLESIQSVLMSNKPTGNISQYDISHSDIVSINKPTCPGKYQSV